MELYQVRYFVALSELLNFTRAAQYCHVTQPALTKAIQKLEAEFGGDLIHRERQLTQLTDLGKLVLPTLQSMVSSADAARLYARDFRSKEIAPLKIGLTPCVSARLIVRPLGEIARLMPGLQVDLVEEPMERLLQLLFEGEVNVALGGGTSILPDRIDHWKLFEERLFVLLSASDPLATGSQISTKALEDIVWLEHIGCEVLSKSWPAISSRRQEPRIGHRGHQESHLQHMVAAGLGAMLIAEHAPYQPSLAAIPIEGNPIWRDVELLAVAGRRYSPALDAFIKIARVFDWSTEVVASRAPESVQGQERSRRTTEHPHRPAASSGSRVAELS